MREVRMTFGEHLEELRKSILVALVYLGVGVGIAFLFNTELLEIALTPHQRAYRAAQEERLMRRFNATLDGLKPLAGMAPQKATLDGKPIVTKIEDVRWAVVFAGDIARARLADGLREPWDAAAGSFEELELPPAQREAIAATVRALGREQSARIAKYLVPELASAATSALPRKFKELENKLRKLSERRTSGLDELIDDGKGPFDAELADLAEFNSFLEQRRQQAVASAVTLAEVEKLASEGSDFGGALLEVHRRLDEVVTKLLSDARPRIMVISYMENFYTHLKVAVIFGLLFSIPFILYELWKFVGAGLYISEQRYVVTFLPFSLALFIAGAIFGFFVLIPIGLTFLATWGQAEVDMNFTLGNYIGLFFTLTLVLGLVFQTPLVMVFLLKIGAVQVSGFRKARKMAILVGVIASAILTPPDPFTLLLMAGPMVLLYEFGIIVCRLLTPREKTSEAAEQGGGS